MQRTKYAAEFKSATPYHSKQSSHFVQRYRVTFFAFFSWKTPIR
jgi:hypothetical protein